jgi:peroxiredoxin
MTRFLMQGMAVLALAASVAGTAAAEPAVGEPAPDFMLTDSNGTPRSLSGEQGTFVVLEWSNHECPFVKKHYGSGNMQQLQGDYTGKGVTWWAIHSSAPGKQGHVTAAQANALRADAQVKSSATLLDPDGAVGQRYGAKTTPHMFVINPEGVLIYKGAIDNKATADQADIASATNYVREALDSAMAGKPVAPAETQPYGCSVKY